MADDDLLTLLVDAVRCVEEDDEHEKHDEHEECKKRKHHKEHKEHKRHKRHKAKESLPKKEKRVSFGSNQCCYFFKEKPIHKLYALRSPPPASVR